MTDWQTVDRFLAEIREINRKLRFCEERLNASEEKLYIRLRTLGADYEEIELCAGISPEARKETLLTLRDDLRIKREELREPLEEALKRDDDKAESAPSKPPLRPRRRYLEGAIYVAFATDFGEATLVRRVKGQKWVDMADEPIVFGSSIQLVSLDPKELEQLKRKIEY